MTGLWFLLVGLAMNFSPQCDPCTMQQHVGSFIIGCSFFGCIFIDNCILRIARRLDLLYTKNM